MTRTGLFLLLRRGLASRHCRTGHHKWWTYGNGPHHSARGLEHPNGQRRTHFDGLRGDWSILGLCGVEPVVDERGLEVEEGGGSRVSGSQAPSASQSNHAFDQGVPACARLNFQAPITPLARRSRWPKLFQPHQTPSTQLSTAIDQFPIILQDRNRRKPQTCPTTSASRSRSSSSRVS